MLLLYVITYPVVVDNLPSTADYAMSTKIVIVGDEKGRFEYGNGDCSTKTEAIALVFSMDRGKPQGT